MFAALRHEEVTFRMVKHAHLAVVSLDTAVGRRVARPAAHHRALRPQLLELDDDVIHKVVFERQAHLPACMGIASSQMGTGSMQTVFYSLRTSITSLQTDMASMRTEVH